MPPVVIYSKKPCVQCVATIRWMGKQGFVEGEHYEVRSIPDSPERVAYFKEKWSVMTAPIVAIEGREPFGGFNPILLEEHLGRYKPEAKTGA